MIWFVVLIALLCGLAVSWEENWLIFKTYNQYGGSGKGCCTNTFKPTTINIGDKEFNLLQLNQTIKKHNDMIKSGIKPYVSLKDELGVSRDELDVILGMDLS